MLDKAYLLFLPLYLLAVLCALYLKPLAWRFFGLVFSTLTLVGVLIISLTGITTGFWASYVVPTETICGLWLIWFFARNIVNSLRLQEVEIIKPGNLLRHMPVYRKLLAAGFIILFASVFLVDFVRPSVKLDIVADVSTGAFLLAFIFALYSFIALSRGSSSQRCLLVLTSCPFCYLPWFCPT